MKAFLKKFFKKLWQILVRIFSFAPYIYSLEQVCEHENEKVPELEHKVEEQKNGQAHELAQVNGDEVSLEKGGADEVNVVE